MKIARRSFLGNVAALFGLAVTGAGLVPHRPRRPLGVLYVKSEMSPAAAARLKKFFDDEIKGVSRHKVLIMDPDAEVEFLKLPQRSIDEIIAMKEIPITPFKPGPVEVTLTRVDDTDEDVHAWMKRVADESARPGKVTLMRVPDPAVFVESYEEFLAKFGTPYLTDS